MKSFLTGCLMAGMILVLGAISVMADEAPGRPEYLFIATSDSFRLEKEMNAAAKDGFRLQFVSDTFAESQIGVLMMRRAAATLDKTKSAIAQQFEYTVLAATRISTLRRDLEAVATQGYELRGLTAKASILPFTASEIFAVLERPAGQLRQRFEFRFLTANREETMQKSLETSVSEGFHPVALSVNRDNNAASVLFGLPVLRYDVVMQRRADNPAADMAVREYRFVSVMKPGTLEKEINQLAKDGWRFQLSGLLGVVLMSRDLKGRPEHRYEYKLLKVRRTGALQKELTASGQQGYIYRGASGIVAIMETDRQAQTRSAQDYKVLAATRVKTARRELDEAVSAGYEVIDLASLGEYIIVLRRATSAN
jgi:hypothetical protein